jgi:hypothetical protein
MSRVELVVDAANVVGSRPDGWWRDRPGAAARLVAALAAALRSGALTSPVAVILEGAARSGVAAGVVAAGEAGASEARPGVVGAGVAGAGEAAAGETRAGEPRAGEAAAGEARAGDDTGEAGAGDELGDGTAPMLRVLHAPADGDSAIVAEVKALVASGVAEVTVVTADRALRASVLAAGGNVVGPSWLHTRLP